jgi:hypothetical protein
LNTGSWKRSGTPSVGDNKIEEIHESREEQEDPREGKEKAGPKR